MDLREMVGSSLLRLGVNASMAVDTIVPDYTRGEPILSLRDGILVWATLPLEVAGIVLEELGLNLTKHTQDV